MQRYVMFGEIMLRLKSPGFERLLQTPVFEATMAGAEANVAVALARFGRDAALVTVVPDQAVGQAVVDELRKHGVDTSLIRRGGSRLGVYYLETGADRRSTRVIYDRAHSSVAEARPGDIDWAAAFAGRTVFFITGITPALSENAAELAREAMGEARRMGLRVVCDLNLRRNLWRSEEQMVSTYRSLMPLVDLLIGNEGHFRTCLGMRTMVDEEAIRSDPAAYRPVAEELFATWPNLGRVGISVRKTRSAESQAVACLLVERGNFWCSRLYEMERIVDRVGGGDCLTAGLLYGLEEAGREQEAVEFAAAASCLKHSIPGDFCRFSAAEVLDVARGAASGRDQR